MAGDPLQNVTSGQRIKRLPAEAWNAFCEAAKDLKRRQSGTDQQVTPYFDQTGIVLIKNDTDEDVEKFGVMAIVEPIVTPAEELSEFKQHVRFICRKPTAGD